MTDNAHHADQPVNTLIRQWVWDILYLLDGQNQFVGPLGFERTDTAKLLGIDGWYDEEAEEFDAADARKRLKAAYRQWQETHDF